MTSVQFQYSSVKGKNVSVELNLPYLNCCKELAHRLIQSEHLFSFEEDQLLESLEQFVNSANEKYHDDLAWNSLSDILVSNNDDEVIKYWENLFKEETSNYGDKTGSSDSELFSTAYHKLVHSGIALDTMLQLEQSYAHEVDKMIKQKDDVINKLTQRQVDERTKKENEVQQGKASPDEINNLDRLHIDQQGLELVKWISKIETLKETQRREYRDWVMEEHQKTLTSQSSFSSPSTPAGMKSFPTIMSRNEADNSNVINLEESFTIHLGSQMKQIYNIRILSANILDLCSVPYDTSNNEQQAQRIQTALSLYTNDLCGTVLLTDSIVSNGGVTRDFVVEASKSTDFHVENVETQLETIKAFAKEARMNKRSIVPGDVFITRHSNLSLAHLVFHLITDDGVYSNDMNSRHTIILGIRNIMKVCCSFDITTLTIPLLLSHEMTESMTVAWCTKRAELVFKCVKGFMIEMTSWGGSELKNVQFVVPKGISEDVFSSLATMLPSIFRVSNPLVFKVK